jgi:hypothetical protein
MKTNKLNMNELELVNGGNFFADLEEVLRNIFQEPAKPAMPSVPTTPAPAIGRGKC